MPQGSTGTINVPDAEPGEREAEEPPMMLGLQASSLMIERTKRFSECSDEELAAVRRMIASAALATRERVRPPHRGSSVR